MGYSVEVHLPHPVLYRRRRSNRWEFSQNISHATMRRALVQIIDTSQEMWDAHGEDVLPATIVDALLPGQNGVDVDAADVAREHRALRLHAHAATDAGFPEAWAVQVLANAADFAARRGGSLYFG